jgi:hypothetical protein
MNKFKNWLIGPSKAYQFTDFQMTGITMGVAMLSIGATFLAQIYIAPLFMSSAGGVPLPTWWMGLLYMFIGLTAISVSLYKMKPGK